MVTLKHFNWKLRCQKLLQSEHRPSIVFTWSLL
jgi:hypothetical protein